jgi:hypothetical protein
MEHKKVINKIKALLKIEVKLEQAKLDNGTTVEAEMFEAGYDIFIINGEEKIPLPVGEYALEDGKMISVTEDGIINEIKESEEPVNEDVIPEAEAPELEAQPEPKAKKIVENVSKEIHFSKEQINALKDELKAEILEELKLAKIEKKAEDIEVELAEEVKPIVASPETSVETKNKNIYSQKKVGLSMQDRVNKAILNYKQK